MPDPDITPARLERARFVLAYIVDAHGAKYAPVFDHIDGKFEREPNVRARQVLRSYTAAGGVKAIR